MVVRGFVWTPLALPRPPGGLHRIGKYPLKRHLRTIRPQSRQNVRLIGCQAEDVVGLPWAEGGGRTAVAEGEELFVLLGRDELPAAPAPRQLAFAVRGEARVDGSVGALPVRLGRCALRSLLFAAVPVSPPSGENSKAAWFGGLLNQSATHFAQSNVGLGI